MTDESRYRSECIYNSDISGNGKQTKEIKSKVKAPLLISYDANKLFDDIEVWGTFQSGSERDKTTCYSENESNSEVGRELIILLMLFMNDSMSIS